MVLRVPLLAIVMALVICGQAAGQSVPVTTLREPSARHGVALTRISGIRELGDGRILVVDRVERIVKLIDLDSGVERVIGRAGRGPYEYETPVALLPVGAEQTLLFDGAYRYLPIASDGTLGEAFRLPDDLAQRSVPIGVDRVGRLYFREGRGLLIASSSPPESPRVFRYDMQANRIQMLGAVSIIRPKHIPVDVAPGETLLLDEPIPFPMEDAWGILPDGELVIARVGTNRVERVGADGTVIGADLPYAATPITQADRSWYMEFWAEQIREEALGIDVASIIDRHSTRVTWPDMKPPFVGRFTFVDSEGRMWLRQTVQDGRDAPTYDLIDRSGVHVRRVVFPARTHLLGFGNGVVFVARTDDMGLQWLERYRFE